MIYVDKLTEFGPQWYHGPLARRSNVVGRRYGHRWSHLMSDGDDEELHAFAKKLGLKRSYAQHDQHGLHYDIVPTRRAVAVRLGAVELEGQAWLDFLKRKRDAAREESPAKPVDGGDVGDVRLELFTD